MVEINDRAFSGSLASLSYVFPTFSQCFIYTSPFFNDNFTVC